MSGCPRSATRPWPRTGEPTAHREAGDQMPREACSSRPGQEACQVAYTSRAPRSPGCGWPGPEGPPPSTSVLRLGQASCWTKSTSMPGAPPGGDSLPPHPYYDPHRGLVGRNLCSNKRAPTSVVGVWWRARGSESELDSPHRNLGGVGVPPPVWGAHRHAPTRRGAGIE
jgi:hypothetical protein